MRRVLISLGVGTTPSAGIAWPIHAAAEPNSPDNVITVYDTVGMDDGRSMIDGSIWRHLGVQVRVRSVDHVTGWRKSDEVQTTLAKGLYYKLVTLDSTRYLVQCASKIGDVLPLGKELPESRRNLFTINALVSIRALD